MSVRLLHSQRKPLLIAAALVYLPVLTLLVATVIVSSLKEIPAANFLRDTTAVSNSPFYTGALSNIGIYLWCFTASVCLFSSAVIFRHANMLRHRNLLLTAGILTLILMIDDAFLVHETVAPRFLGISGTVIVGLYGILMIGFLLYNWKAIYRSDYTLLLAGLTFLALSLVFDFLQDYRFLRQLGMDSVDMQYLLEDGSKLFGIAGWFSYFVWHSYTCVSVHGRTTQDALPDVVPADPARDAGRLVGRSAFRPAARRHPSP